MPLSDFRDTYSWQEAIALGPELVTLAEQLPASEQFGLSQLLREAMIDLPASIGLDLLEGGSHTRRTVILRFTAALDIIDKVYPALDTAEVRKALEKLVERITSDRFGEQTAGAAHAYLPGAARPLALEARADDHPNPTLKIPVEAADSTPAESAETEQE